MYHKLVHRLGISPSTNISHQLDKDCPQYDKTDVALSLNN
jgi:hypothetical protein